MPNELVKCPLCSSKVKSKPVEFLECPFCHCTFQRPAAIEKPKPRKKRRKR